MILRSGFKVEAFIHAIECTIARDRHACKSADELTREAIDARAEGVIYLAGGYWRALPIWTDADEMIGARLINPDRTAGEIQIVEQGISILCCLEYQP